MQEDLQSLYAWVDTIPLSRPKRNIARDFSDAVLFAEVVHHFFPSAVDLHNFVPCHSVSSKQTNWDTLQLKVMKKLKCPLDPRDVELASNSVPGAIERILKAFKVFVDSNKNVPLTSSANSTPAKKSQNASSSPKKSTKVTRNLPESSDAVSQILDEKDAQIRHLQNTIDILESKLTKLSQLVRLKDSRIAALTSRLAELEIGQ
ncbi:hypothetical protein RCL1_005401 [Eukaryota sp. TZLM3-RCL]